MVKKIHYCWLGSTVPDSVRRQTEQWRSVCPDFSYHEWNDENSAWKEHPYYQQAAKVRRWAFASDVVQLNALYEHGGFYLDCDVLLLKPLDSIPVPGDHLIMGYMYDCALSGGFMYAPPKHPLVKKMLEYYDDINPGFFAVNNTILTDCINNNVDDFLLNGRFYQSEKYKLTIFPKEYFCHPSIWPNKSFLVDLFLGSWRTANSAAHIVRCSTGGIRALRRQISCFRALRRNEFFEVYKQARKGNKVRNMEYWRREYGVTGGAIKLPVE